MKQYPEIKYFGDYWGLPIIAFDKIDGSNLRFEYSQKRGFYKFGTRQMMIDKSHESFGFAIDIFLNKYSESLTKIFKSKEYRNTLSFVCYGELAAPGSEFGQHDFTRKDFDVTLFDIEAYKTGFIPPRQFVKDFKAVGIPEIIYEGNLSREFVSAIKNDEYGIGHTNLSEGVVCKGVIQNKKEDNIFSCKIKTTTWFERLRNKIPDLYATEIKESEI